MWQHQIESLQPFLELALFCYKDICNSSWKLELRYINRIETLQSNLGAYTFMTICMDIACCPVVDVQLLNCVWLFANPWTAACQASLSFTVSQNLLKLTSNDSVMPSNHFILCGPLLLLSSILPSIRVFSMNQLFASGGQSVGASTSSSVLSVNIQVWSTCCRRDSQESFSASHIKSINSSVFSLLDGQTLTSVYDYWKKTTA